MLKTSRRRPRAPSGRRAARTTSETWQKQRLLVPSPKTVMRLARQRLAHEVRDDHPVAPGLPRADGVEEAPDDRRQLALLPVGEGEELVDRLRARIGPAALAVGRGPGRRPRGTGVVALAVDLAGGGDEDRLLFLVAWTSTTSVAWTFVSIVRTGLSTISSTPTAAARWKTASALSTSSATSGVLVAGVDRVLEAVPVLEVADVVDPARREVVEDVDRVPARRAARPRDASR